MQKGECLAQAIDIEVMGSFATRWDVLMSELCAFERTRKSPCSCLFYACSDRFFLTRIGLGLGREQVGGPIN